MDTPEIIDRYLQLGTGPNHAATAACFTPDATVSDDGRTYHGRPEIRAWREALAGQFTYTVKVLGPRAARAVATDDRVTPARRSLQ